MSSDCRSIPLYLTHFFTYSIVLVSITFLQNKLMSLGMILLGFALTPDEEDIAMF